jgi:hypothetical protein
MRIRKTDDATGVGAGDMRFGHGLADFWINVPDAPATAVMYRLKMSSGEWWLNTSLGTPWQTKVIGFGTASTRDPVIRSQILGTQDITTIGAYSSSLDRNTRGWSVNAQLQTIYSSVPTNLDVTLGAVG